MGSLLSSAPCSWQAVEEYDTFCPAPGVSVSKRGHRLSIQCARTPDSRIKYLGSSRPGQDGTGPSKNFVPSFGNIFATWTVLMANGRPKFFFSPLTMDRMVPWLL